jgi:hypothetical protein
VIVVAEPQIMMFTFAFGYSLSGPAWAVCKIVRKWLTDAKAKRTQCRDLIL